jgi:hypothetical protein
MNPTNPFAACPQGWNKKVLFFRYYTQDETAAREANSKTKPLPYLGINLGAERTPTGAPESGDSRTAKKEY